MPENLEPTPSLKFKRVRASAIWKKIAGKTVEQSFKEYYITKAFDGIEVEILWDIFELESLILKAGKNPPDVTFSHPRRLKTS
jgi:hypothetical protein